MASLAKIYYVLKPILAMFLYQAVQAIANICYKLAANDGMRLPVLVAYRFTFGAVVMVPIAYFAERKKRPKLTWEIIFYGFLCGFFGGSLWTNLYLKSLTLTSVNYASATTNLVPAITFIIAVCLRLENLGWNTSAGKAKVLGTILGIGGAMVLTIYKGPQLNLWNTNINLLETTRTHHHAIRQIQHRHDIILGALLALTSCISSSLWLIFQAKAMDRYPCPYTLTAMTTGWASIQGTAFALSTETDWSNWILGWDIRLLSVSISGILSSGLMFVVLAWCIRVRGPLFGSIFNPLLLVFVAIAGSFILEQKLHLGMVVGSILIVGGLYVVLWGKSKEIKKVPQLKPVSQVQIDMPPLPSSAAVTAK